MASAFAELHAATVHCGGLCACWIDSGSITGVCAQNPPAAKPKTKQL